jgi:hypothetical protein
MHESRFATDLTGGFLRVCRKQVEQDTAIVSNMDEKNEVHF